jgi:hypothetical protein
MKPSFFCVVQALFMSTVRASADWEGISMSQVNKMENDRQTIVNCNVYSFF